MTPASVVASTSGVSSDAPEVELRRVTKRFGATLALDAVDLTIGKGEIHALVGQNGSGKSTLIKILAGYHAPEPGSEIWIGGEAVDPGRTYDPAALNLRFVHQGLGLIEEMDAVDNIAMAGGYLRSRTRRIQWRQQATLTRRLLGELGLEFDVRSPASECSAVERTGIAIARALAGTRSGEGLLVLDEPSVALTPSETQRLFDVVRRLASSGLSVLYVSHHLGEVFELADSVTVLRDGRVVDRHTVSAIDKRQLIHLMVGDVLETQRHEKCFDVEAEPRLSVDHLVGAGLEGVSFSIRPGEVVGVAGTAGSGRDRLALALIGASGRTTGEITLDRDGLPAERDPRNMRDRGVVLVPADRHRQGLLSQFTVAENMTLADMRPLRSKVRWIRKSVEHSTVDRWSESLDVRPRVVQAPISTLSGGNQQKVVLAKWLRLHPKVVILDEPTSGVDVGARAMIYDIIRQQAAKGLAVLVCSSDLDELVQLADRVLVMRHGMIIDELSGQDVTESAILHSMETDSAPSNAGAPNER